MVTGNRRKWAVGSSQYVDRSARDRKSSGSEAPLVELPGSQESEDRLMALGITWEPFDTSKIAHTPLERTQHRFRNELPELIWNTAALEGNNFTLPEVRTLLDGTTVGGKRIEDEKQIVALSEAYSRVDELVATGGFRLSKEVSDGLHRLVAVHEALDAGQFRGEGTVTGGGAVRLSTGGMVEGTAHGAGGALLRGHFDDLVDYLQEISDPRQQALIYFASATRRQFYFDGNKRTARLMMTGHLMSNGFDVISIPFARRLEFNNALDTLFATDDATDLLQFLATCTLPR